jgi:hypothetical protein
MSRGDFTFTGFDHCLLAEDEADVEVRLRAKFPNIRFVQYEYWQDEEIWLAEQRKVFRQPPDLFVPYLPSLAAEDGRHATRIWLEPEGWEPDWQIWPESGDDESRPLNRLFNMPPSFRLLHTRPRNGDLRHSSIDATILRGDKAHLSFVQAAARIFKRNAVTQYDVVYDDTGKVRFANQRVTMWTGQAAQAWCAADPVRRIDHCLRPAGSPGAPLPMERWSASYCEIPERAPNFAEVQALNARIEALRRKTAENAARRAAAKTAREAKAKP